MRPLIKLWRVGSVKPSPEPVYVSMNDYLVGYRDVLHVGAEGLRFYRRWPRTEGAVGLWVASSADGRRQISVSIWRARDDLRRFVRSDAHRRVMRDFRAAGDLITNAWTSDRFDRDVIWQQASERLAGRVPGVAHH